MAETTYNIVRLFSGLRSALRSTTRVLMVAGTDHPAYFTLYILR